MEPIASKGRCRKITAAELQELIQDDPGSFALFRLTSSRQAETLFYSPDRPGLCGYTREEYEKISHAAFVEHHYGTPKDKEEEMRSKGYNVFLEIDVKGAKQVMEKCPDAISIFLLPPSFQELENRIRGRSTEVEKVIEERLAKAKSEIALAKNYKYQVVNDSIERATQEIVSIIAHEIACAK